MEREFEAKQLISEEQFKLLINNLNQQEVRNQTNIYLDTKDGFFKQQNSALRLRNINGQLIFSLKRQDKDGATEWNQPLSNTMWDTIIRTKQIDLSDFNCPQNDLLVDLQLVEIETTRYVCDYNRLTIELDKTRFNQTIDFEIEIEASNLQTARETMEQLITEYDLSVKKSYPKIARYYMYN